MANIAEDVKAIIVEKLGVDASEVTETASFTNDLGADSLDIVELIMEFEKKFDIEIPDDDWSFSCFYYSLSLVCFSCLWCSKCDCKSWVVLEFLL